MRLKTLFIFVFIAIFCRATPLFYYSPKNGEGGLRFFYQNTAGEWKEIGNKFDFLNSDFGSWGKGKKMWRPRLFKSDKDWLVIFGVTPDLSVYGLTESSDLMNWQPQKYFSAKDIEREMGKFKEVSREKTINFEKKEFNGYVVDVPNEEIDELISHVERKNALKQLYAEKATEDSVRFRDLSPVRAALEITGQSKDISPLLFGIFFEDINYAADGGLYAELIQNRDFEYDPSESKKEGWGPFYGWTIADDDVTAEIGTDNPLHANNPHYIRLTTNRKNTGKEAVRGLINKGFDGISLKGGADYKLRFKYRTDQTSGFSIKLKDENGQELTTGDIQIPAVDGWESFEIILNPKYSTTNAYLEIIPLQNGIIDLDMISLFPEDTFKGRENGLRKDLAETLEALNPRFVRFPGGCVAHGNGIDNIYDWKGSVGELEERKPLFNLWGYHQTRGLGYFEYFQFCEDIGAEPLPVLAAGVPCQNSSRPSRFTHDEISLYGQQGGIPLDLLDSYILDILDLIEYANGPVTSKWGSKRAQAGHPEPFNLRYIGIGNEDLISDIFEERFIKIHDAIKREYPEITVIGTVGPFYEGPDYNEGWRFAKEHNLDMVDEHYYVEPGWLIYNQDFYDDYDRDATKVYLGEWAAHLPDRSSTMETALSEALYITALERNGDVVSMSSYAPLLAKDGHTQWRPDMIYFTNDTIKLTPDYHVMKLAGENAGNKYYSSIINCETEDSKVEARIAASVVRDEESGDFIVKLVNLLPQEVEFDINLSSIISGDQEGVLTVMEGNADDEEPNFSTGKIKVSEKFSLSLPRYSLSIVRF